MDAYLDDEPDGNEEEGEEENLNTPPLALIRSDAPIELILDIHGGQDILDLRDKKAEILHLKTQLDDILGTCS